MSEYFSRQNQGVEFGPGPSDNIMWMVVDPVSDECTKVCYVRARTAFEARHEAQKYIDDLSNKAVFYPNTVRYPSDK